MNIRVFSQTELEKSLKKGSVSPALNLISIGNPNNGSDHIEKVMPSLFKDKYINILHMEFWDVHKAEPGCIKEGEIKRFPELKDIEESIDFFKKNSGDIDIHCWRGISRSTAIAYILLYLTHKNEMIAANNLIRIRRNAMPNKLILELFDRAYDTNLSDLKNTIFKARILKMREESGL